MQTLINSPDIAHQALLPLDKIERSITNPRKRFDGDIIVDMANSIAKVGVLQPILVRPHPVREDKYEIVAGECRYRGALMAGLETIPAIIRDLTDLEALELQVLENLHRNDLHPLEEAEGFQQLLEANGYTVEMLAGKLGKSKAAVYASLKLCALCPTGREAFYDGKLTASTALLVARIPGAALQAKALAEIIKPVYNGALPSYREAVGIIRWRYTLNLDTAAFDRTDCQSCEKRSGNCREIYPDIDSADVCTDPDCFGEKRQAHIDQLLQDPNTITGEAAKKIMPHGGWIDSETYGEPEDDAEFGDGEQSWAEVLGNELPTRTLVIEGRDPFVVVDLAAARQLAQSKGLNQVVSEQDEDERAENAKTAALNAAKEAELERRSALLVLLHQRLTTGSAAIESVLPIAISFLLAELTARMAPRTLACLFTARGETIDEDTDNAWLNYVNNLDRNERFHLLIEIALLKSGEFNLTYLPWEWKPEAPTKLDEAYTILRAAGIDPDASETDETPTDPASAAHAAEEIAREENPADETQPGARTAAQANEPAAEAQPEATPIEAAEKPAAKKRGRPRKQAVETPVAEVTQ
ncbi:ParB/RepB/Spo0J family partition protein [Nitrosospira sp. Nsp11]|uniref:ParB/RepB/Spo0J family partition protein n=1 Tax=Nitrosospira sp. Nsp11 TaxID=1855338 RepID=UPI000923FA22|nr:ParB/RepB/Spo0J family partition protein [Nitrosospira sp. Nsp11]SHL11247.1 ParB/RepB/Spo0J family partition protein [Nitrosospira sp. Nsp11]